MKKCVFGLLLGVIVMFNTISPNFIVQAAETDNEATETYLKSVSFTSKGKEISEGDTISLEDGFKVEYKLKSPLYMNYEEDEKEEDQLYLSKGDELYLPAIIDTAFDLSQVETFDVKLDDDTEFGKASITPDRQVKVDVTYEDYAKVYDVVVGLEFGLDEEAIGEKEEYTFTIPGMEPKTLTLKIKENNPEEPKPVVPTDVTTLTKDGGEFDAEGKANWNISLGNNGVELTDVVLYDAFVVDNNTDMDFLKNSLVITDESGEKLKADKDYELIYTKGESGVSESGKKYTWAIKFGKISGEKNYQISYDTQLGSYDKYLFENHSVPANKAWVEYNYIPEEGADPAFIVGVGVDKKATGEGIVGKSAIDKALYSAEPAFHQLTWRIVVNRNYRPLTNASVTEKLGDGQKLVSISDVTITNTDGENQVVTMTPSKNEEGSLVFDFGDSLNNSRAVFYVVTELTDEEIPVWEADSTKKYKNFITLQSDQQEPILDTASGRLRWKDDALEKTASVDKKTKKVSYTVNINKGKQLLPSKLQIKDTLGKNLVLYPESVKLFIGIVDASGKVTATEELETGYKTAVSMEGDNEVLAITLPEKADNRNVYVLKYEAIPDEIIEDGDYTNRIQLLGYGYDYSNRDKIAISYKAFGGGWIEKHDRPKRPGEKAPTPKPSSNNKPSGNNSGSSSNPSAKSSTSDVVGFGEVVISVGANTGANPDMTEENITAASNGANTLAKTGGFIGTVIGYMVGVVFVIAGLFMVFGKRKKNC
jgi:hypothetical protein